VLEVVKRIFSQHNTRNGFFSGPKGNGRVPRVLTQISSLETDVVDPLYSKDVFLFSLPDTQDFYLLLFFFFVARTYPHLKDIIRMY